MSILIKDLSRCPLCEKPLKENDLSLSFPAFVWEDSDPHIVFNDATIHMTCLENRLDRSQILEIREEALAASLPANRICAVCDEIVDDPDDYLMIPRLGSKDDDPIRQFRYTHLHRSHLNQWKSKETLRLLLTERLEQCPANTATSSLLETLAQT